MQAWFQQDSEIKQDSERILGGWSLVAVLLVIGVGKIQDISCYHKTENLHLTGVFCISFFSIAYCQLWNLSANPQAIKSPNVTTWHRVSRQICTGIPASQIMRETISMSHFFMMLVVHLLYDLHHYPTSSTGSDVFVTYLPFGLLFFGFLPNWINHDLWPMLKHTCATEGQSLHRWKTIALMRMLLSHKWPLPMNHCNNYLVC